MMLNCWFVWRFQLFWYRQAKRRALGPALPVRHCAASATMESTGPAPFSPVSVHSAKSTMRHVFCLLHRWVGLTFAALLFVARAFGAVISWDHELDEWLNPHLHEARSGPAQPALELARRFEAAN